MQWTRKISSTIHMPDEGSVCQSLVGTPHPHRHSHSHEGLQVSGHIDIILACKMLRYQGFTLGHLRLHCMEDEFKGWIASRIKPCQELEVSRKERKRKENWTCMLLLPSLSSHWHLFLLWSITSYNWDALFYSLSYRFYYRWHFGLH